MLLEDLVKEYKRTKDRKLLNEIIERNLSLVNYFAEHDDDMYMLALEGLYYAILNYNPKYNKGFQNFACIVIKYYILNYLRKNNNASLLYENFLVSKSKIEEKFGITLEKDFQLFDYIIDYMIENNLIREQNRSLISKKLILFLKRGYFEYRTMGDTVDSEEIDADMIYDLTFEEIRQDIEKLDFITGEILRLKYGFGIEPQKIEDIADILKYSAPTISKKLKKGLEELRNNYLKRGI